MKICTIIGVRPQFVKAAEVSRAIEEHNKKFIIRNDKLEISEGKLISEVIIHTGQHFDDNMSASFFRDLGLLVPDYDLGTGRVSSSADMINQMITGIESVLLTEQPDAVLIYGDTNTSLAGALAADKLHIPVIHIEAGERAGWKTNLEERNRIEIDKISSLLLCSSEQAVSNLADEGISNDVYFVGNLMEDSFLHNINKSWQRNLINLINHSLVAVPEKFCYLTCHRQENANDKNLTEILSAMNTLPCPTIYPVHPRNKDRVRRIIDRSGGFSNIIFTEPAGYFDSIHLTNEAQVVVTDSGGVLQEAHFAQTPYVFVIDTDHVPASTRFDVSRLAKPDREDIVRRVAAKQHFGQKPQVIGVAAERIVEIISEWIKKRV